MNKSDIPEILFDRCSDHILSSVHCLSDCCKGGPGWQVIWAFYSGSLENETIVGPAQLSHKVDLLHLNWGLCTKIGTDPAQPVGWWIGGSFVIIEDIIHGWRRCWHVADGGEEGGLYQLGCLYPVEGVWDGGSDERGYLVVVEGRRCMEEVPPESVHEDVAWGRNSCAVDWKQPTCKGYCFIASYVRCIQGDVDKIVTAVKGAIGAIDNHFVLPRFHINRHICECWVDWNPTWSINNIRAVKSWNEGNVADSWVIGIGWGLIE